MCGIAGIFDVRQSRPVSPRLLGAMTDAIAHRGPDGHDQWHAPGVGFGHRRLSIVDLAGGHQPMLSADGQIVLVFNGMIYNFMEIRADLETRGHVFRTRSDTEVIIAAWQEWRESCVDRLRGMFAFAIYDARTRELFLARDRLGVKPLFYAALPDGTLAFGSELKALLPHPALSRDIDPTAVEDYFAYGYVPDPKSILSSVKKLPAAHTMTVRHGQAVPEPSRYWDVDFTTRHHGKADDLADELVERVREAVRLRMVADVPLGAFLSGGVDSSAVVAMMSGLSNQPVNTCSIGFDARGFDESGYAKQVADRYHTNHRTRIVAADDFALVDRLAAAYDEPYADASALPTFRVCELARETVTVALSGDGADEAFGGYRRYRMHGNEERVRQLLPAGLRGAVFGPLGRHFPKLDWAPRFLRGKTSFESLALTSGEAYFNSIAVTPDRVRNRLMTDRFRQLLDGHSAGKLYADTIATAPASDAVGAAQYADIRHWLPGDILTKVDRASMAVSLEAREPLLDHELVQWAAGLPADMRIRGGEGKWLLKKAMEPHVTQELLYRPKMGFVVPISNWFRGALAGQIRDLVATSPVLESGWFDQDFLAASVTDHRAGRADHGRLLWQMLMFDRSLAHIGAAPVAQAG